MFFWSVFRMWIVHRRWETKRNFFSKAVVLINFYNFAEESLHSPVMHKTRPIIGPESQTCIYVSSIDLWMSVKPCIANWNFCILQCIWDPKIRRICDSTHPNIFPLVQLACINRLWQSVARLSYSAVYWLQLIYLHVYSLFVFDVSMLALGNA